jgi:hypothetical protein
MTFIYDIILKPVLIVSSVILLLQFSTWIYASYCANIGFTSIIWTFFAVPSPFCIYVLNFMKLQESIIINVWIIGIGWVLLKFKTIFKTIVPV